MKGATTRRRPEKTGDIIEKFIDHAIDKSGIDATWVWKSKRFDDGGFLYSPGNCRVHERVITLSKKYCENRWRFHKDEIIDLIAHELAHIAIPNHSMDFKYSMVLLKSKLNREIDINTWVNMNG